MAINFRRGVLRLCLVLWAFGAGLLFVWSSEVLHWPGALVCSKQIQPPYRECLTDTARAFADSERWSDRILRLFSEDDTAIDASRSVRRYQTARWRGAARTLLVRQLLWAAAILGGYLLFHWIAEGFRPS